jgi:hypothetical protein
MLVAATVVTMFVCFALPLAWVSRRTFGQEPFGGMPVPLITG